MENSGTIPPGEITFFALFRYRYFQTFYSPYFHSPAFALADLPLPLLMRFAHDAWTYMYIFSLFLFCRLRNVVVIAGSVMCRGGLGLQHMPPVLRHLPYVQCPACISNNLFLLLQCSGPARMYSILWGRGGQRYSKM